MKKSKLLLKLILCFLFATCSISKAGEIPFEKGTLRDVVRKAELAKKLIFVDAYTSWCGPCKWMASTIFTKEEVIEFYGKNFICYKLDMEKGEGIDFAKKYDVHVYPTYLFLDASGQMVHQVCGKMEMEAFIEEGKKAINPETQLLSLKNKFNEKNRDFKFLKTYAQALNNANLNAEEVTDLLVTSPQSVDLINESDFDLLSGNCSVNSQTFNFIMEYRQKYIEASGKSKVEEFTTSVFLNEAYEAGKKKSMDALQKAQEIVQKNEFENSKELILHMNLQYAKTAKLGIMEAAKPYIEGFKMQDPDELNNVSWVIFENSKNPKELEIAANWAKQSVALKKGFANLDTYANILHKLNRNSEAMKIAMESIALAKQENQDVSSTEDLVKEIEVDLKKGK